MAAMADAGPCVLLAIKILKCRHQAEKNLMTTIHKKTPIIDIFAEHHEGPAEWPKGYKTRIVCRPNLPSATTKDEPYEIDGNLTVGEVVSGFGMKHFQFSCEVEESQDTELRAALTQAAQTATRKTIDAFQLLMAKGRAYPTPKTTSSGKKVGLSRKDELYNDLVNLFKTKGLDFPRSVADTEGAYFLQVLCNALWYVTNQHQVINDAALRQKNVHPIPSVFCEYAGYNNMKRKKMKELPMSAEQLHSHSQALYSILMKPVVGSSAEWKVAGENIKELAKCLEGYSEYLLEKKESIQSNQNLDHPVRTIDEHGTVEHRRMTSFEVKSQYKLLDQVVKSSPALTPVIFNEEKHLDKPFENAKQRLRYFEGLQLSVPIDIIRFSPGGSVVTTFCIFRVKADQTESEILIEGARMLQKARPYLQECHTRAQKALFRERLQNLTHVMPSVADLIYKELTLDAATAAHPTTQERLRRIFLGEKGLLADLRHLNAGRPTGKYDAFFEQLANVVEDITAADERRHNIAHLAEWLSLGELVRKTEEQCPPDTPVPSKSLVRLQFAPRNPYTHKALTFTSKIQVQYKIQRRQLRVTHPDEHYCAAQFKYFKEKAVELKEKAAVFFCDDKAKVPIGEPGAPISTGVRGKKSIAPSTTTLAAKDHDMSMSSVTPSVVLQCEVPDDATKSFVRGTVTTVVNDSVFQMSSPFRHAAALIKVMQQSQGKDAKILMKFTDGGTDQRNTLEAVKCASICIFYELNLDMVILARCAPGHSWMNPAERVMSILNIGLQNCALQRMESDEGTERELKKCGSMAQIRSLGEKKPEIKEKWMEIMEPIQSTIRNRFMRLALKDKPIQALDPVSEDEIDVLQRHLREHFPELDLHKLQKIHTQKVLSYKQWMEKHCRQRQYTFQIRKCDDEECCLRPTLDRENLNWLPDPVVNQSDEAHFLPYPSVKQQDTTEEARPSLKQVKVRTSKKNDARKDDIEQEVEGPEATGNENQELNQGNTEENTEHTGTEHELVEEPKFADFHLTTAQHARTAVSCTECRKPRVIYSKFALTDRQNMSLVKLLSEEYEYTCGAPVTPPRHILHGVTMSRDNLTCASPVEIPYYSSDMGRKDICCHCGVEESEVDNDMKKKFRTILPVWADCLKAGKVPVVSRPYGKERKK